MGHLRQAEYGDYGHDDPDWSPSNSDSGHHTHVTPLRGTAHTSLHVHSHVSAQAKMSRAHLPPSGHLHCCEAPDDLLALARRLDPAKCESTAPVYCSFVPHSCQVQSSSQ